MQNPLTPAGIEPASFRFVAQHLNHCATAVPENFGTDRYFAANNTYTTNVATLYSFFVTYPVEHGALEEKMATHQRRNSTQEDTVGRKKKKKATEKKKVKIPSNEV